MQHSHCKYLDRINEVTCKVLGYLDEDVIKADPDPEYQTAARLESHAGLPCISFTVPC